ncbi:hypothetical protein LLR08_24260 [Rouxiella badensis]|uniref:hypothetical protein n=1 Tax=Rouxiella badensis TaxID=1646377 RepID=UPI001D14E798|nr:hypothetical protein [Rouxiella badensis]MCC3705646.1 hypothetical protein [Rouxiella badensis]
MKSINKQRQEVAAHIDAGRASGFTNITGSTIEEMIESFNCNFNLKDKYEKCQMKGLHGHSKKKHICG